ncbi:hypothetical protein TNCV_4169611 [Trichonephila clavipes]|nr:hypothetical protein TNCV_4169611 [Trichonephila clavipes]
MITTNIDVTDGLANGAVGKLVHVETNDEGLVKTTWLEFPDLPQIWRKLRRKKTISSYLYKITKPIYMSRLTQYGGYGTYLVIEWARVRIPNKARMYLREKKSGSHLKLILVSNEKQCNSSVLCWGPHL